MEIATMVVHSTSEHPAPDPVVYIDGGLALVRIPLGDGAPRGGGALGVLQLRLVQQGSLAQVRELLGQLGRGGGELLQHLGERGPLLTRAVQALQGAQAVEVARLQRQQGAERLQRGVAIVELLLLDQRHHAPRGDPLAEGRRLEDGVHVHRLADGDRMDAMDRAIVDQGEHRVA